MVHITRLGPDDVERVVAMTPLFDETARREWASLFLTRDGHHLLVATVDENDVGFISGVELTHPDKGTEMLLYELAVDESYRRRGIAHALVDALHELARERGCYGMWVGTEPDNDAAIATYRSAGSEPAEPFVGFTWTFD
jgi:ribosomal protein S18 acetylase RimI-like enzyme